MSYLDQIAQKRLTKKEIFERKQDQSLSRMVGQEITQSIEKVIDKLDKGMKPLDPQLGESLDKLSEVAKELQKLPKEYDMSNVVRELKAVSSVISKLPGRMPKTDINQVSKELKELKAALNSKNFSPNITVKPPVVNVNTPEGKEEWELECYKAQDIKVDGAFQYVGFLNSEGGWYIMQNDMEKESLRYCFGVDNYEKAWKDPVNKDYKLLNEAIDAIRT